MPKYNVKTIKNRVADGDNLFDISENTGSGGKYALTPNPISVSEEGTTINAGLLQNHENLCGAVATEINGGDSTSNTSTTYTDDVLPSDKISTTLKLRQDTQSNFNSNNPTLASGEVGLDTTNHTIVVGDGSTAYNSLQYYLNLGSAYNTTSYIHTDVVLGRDASASSYNDVVIGYGASATSYNDVVIGYGASATSYNDVVIGYGASATSYYDVVIGYGASATSYYDVAIGYNSTASGGVAVGLGAKATGSSSVALGSQTSSSGSGSAAVGYSSTASGGFSVVMGNYATASANYSIKIGYGSSSSTTYDASGTYSIAIGYHSGATYNYSCALGYNATTDGTYRIQLGGSSNSYVYYYGTLSSRSDERDKFDMRQFDNKAILDFVIDLDTFDYLRNPRGIYQYTELDENGEEYVADPNFEKYGLGAYDHEAHDRGDKAGSRRRAGISAQNIQEKMKEHFGAEYNLNLVNDNLYDKRKAGEEIPEEVESQLEVSYISFIPLLISCIKEQQKEIEELKEEIEKLNND